ncbi:hypothetical protein H2203_007822 [Taxawa tesnikishii (nom. ined.)]|nr:hypothetical protein H2203_007822 [Dothideales sp. JES 119]
MDLSILPAEPEHHPDCCLALSQRLINVLYEQFPQGETPIISIGSGTGLLEALLLECAGSELDIRGVEVSPAVNKYLPEENMTAVNGTWDLYTAAASAPVWMFVYPRLPNLVARYLNSHGGDSPRKVIWLGPKRDWEDYQTVFESSEFSNIAIIDDCGAATYEMMAVATRK